MSDLPSFGDVPFPALGATLLYQLLGPTAQYLGGKSKELAEASCNNLEAIFRNAAKKLGEDINKPGNVPPRVLRGTVNEGAFCEDAVASEYLGGILASSRGEGDRDDRGVVMNSLVSRLSVYQLRTHYITYWMLKDLFQGIEIGLDSIEERHNGVAIPLMSYMAAMDFHGNELRTDDDKTDYWLASILEHTFSGLYKENLIGWYSFSWGELGKVELTGTRFGMELFMWAYGQGKLPTSMFFNSEWKVEPINGIILSRDRIPIHSESESAPVGYVEPYDFAYPKLINRRVVGANGGEEATK